MARYESPIILKGKIDGLSFYETSEGYFVRRPGGASRSKIMHDPNFAKTRENMQEFTEVARSNKLLRKSFGMLYHQYKDRKAYIRFTSKLFDVLKNDVQSSRGSRRVPLGLDTEAGRAVLNGFDFNINAPLSSVFPCGYRLDSDQCLLEFSEIILGKELTYPLGTTDINIRMIASVVDFERGIFEYHETPVLRIKSDSPRVSGVLKFEQSFLMEGPRFFVLVIEYFREEGGGLNAVEGGAFNLVSLLGVGSY